ncbi:MAG: peroxidase-related enzyme [Paracoccaceae bacterium]
MISHGDKICRFPIPEISSLPEDIRKEILKIQKKMGFVPNVFLILSRRPEEFRAFFAFNKTLMEEERGLTKAEKEMIVVATSAENNCQYCVVAHGAVLRIRTKNPTIADQIAINYRKADLSEREIAMLDFAVKVTNESDKISEDDYQKLYSFNFSDEDIWDIASISAFFGMSNRLANFGNMRPNREFFSMGR